MVIYKITNLLNGKFYIGQTIQKVEERWNRHCLGIDKTAISLALKKYGKENFKFEVIDVASSLEELNDKETFWIKSENCISPNGYNLRPGGDNREVSEETRKKCSDQAKRNGVGKWCRNSNHIEANKFRGKKQFEDIEFKNKWALSKNFKPINVFKISGEFVGQWYMSTECAKILNVKARSIRQCLLGKQKAHKGYIFRY